MKPFFFQKFTIQQSEKVFRVGTDGVLLGAMCSLENPENILEVGTGTGLVSLMIAQRNSLAQISALDIDENAVKLANENFKNSPFSEKLKIFHQDFKTFNSEDKFDLIISNPPYFDVNSSEKNILARQQAELSYENLIKNSVKNLSETGLLSVIIPIESGNIFEKMAFQNKLFLYRKVHIFGIQNSKAKRWILEFSFNKKPVIEEEFTIEKSPRKYSDQYMESTKAFHVFEKK